MGICVCVELVGMIPPCIQQDTVYTLMENSMKVVLDMAVVDKRETGGNSVAIEKEGLR